MLFTLLMKEKTTGSVHTVRNFSTFRGLFGGFTELQDNVVLLHSLVIQS